MRVLDLTQPLGEDTVLWPGSQPVSVETPCTHETHGFYAQNWRTPEHAGTHLDAPAHFAPAGIRADAVPAEKLVVPCAVIDVRERAAADADLTLSRADVEAAEDADGAIEPGSAVLLCTGWDTFRGDAGRYLGVGDDLHFPGFGVDAAETLIEREAVGLGTDTLGIDPGYAADVPVHHLTLPAGLWHLEGLVNLHELPRRGALLFAGALKLVEGSGAPARVLAVV